MANIAEQLPVESSESKKGRESGVFEKASQETSPEVQFEELEGDARDEIERAAREAEAYAETHHAADLAKEIQHATEDAREDIQSASHEARGAVGMTDEVAAEERPPAQRLEVPAAPSTEQAVSAPTDIPQKPSEKLSKSRLASVAKGVPLAAVGTAGVGFLFSGGILKGISKAFDWIDKGLGKLFSGKDILGAPERFLNWLGDVLEGKKSNDKKT
jgi:hypothetical protein